MSLLSRLTLNGDKRFESVVLVLALLSGLALLVAQQFLSVSGHGWNPMREALNNAAHIPWFACVTGVIWFLMRSQSSRVLATAAIAAALAVASEGIQLFTGRDAALGDLLYNLLAAGCTIAVLAGSGAIRWLTLLLALAVMASGPAWIAWGELQRRLAWPDLLVADSQASRGLLHSHGEMRWRDPPTGWPGVSGPVLELTFADKSWPGVHLHGQDRRWAEFDELVVDVFVPGDAALELMITTTAVNLHQTGAWRAFELTPGPHRLVLPTSALILDELRVRSLFVYADQSQAGKRVMIGAAFLRRAGDA